MGNNRNNIETPPGRVAEHLAEIHISYQHIIILRASYIMVSEVFRSINVTLLEYIGKPFPSTFVVICMVQY